MGKTLLMSIVAGGLIPATLLALSLFVIQLIPGFQRAISHGDGKYTAYTDLKVNFFGHGVKVDELRLTIWGPTLVLLGTALIAIGLWQISKVLR
jgi:hypothetical protein